jgi:hypothetical protein
LLYGGVAAGWELLADGHTELLDACQLSLHCCHTCSLVLDGFLRGSICGTKVCKGFAVQCKQRVVIHIGHTVAMVRSQDGRLFYKHDCIGPILLEGLDWLNDQWALVITSNPILVFLGIHATALDDVQACVDYIAVLRQVACHTWV